MTILFSRQSCVVTGVPLHGRVGPSLLVRLLVRLDERLRLTCGGDDRIQRSSINSVIVDEVELLNGDEVLFHLNSQTNSAQLLLYALFSLKLLIMEFLSDRR